MKQIVVIVGHPNKESFNYALADAYVQGALQSEAQVSRINIADLDFNPNMSSGNRQASQLEPDLKEAIEKIKKADHIVWVYPMWWYGSPALMKGFIDRTFLPGIAYKYVEGKAFPKKLFKGKTARLIITADTPRWYDYLFMKSPAINQLKKGTLQFSGVSPVKVSFIAPIIKSKETFRTQWLQKVTALGRDLK
ncbi:MAG: flavodoxin family protein [Bacteroidetes bacterium]|nr:MAG: flavodoxin family protein [Bacteroidota bacterium]